MLGEFCENGKTKFDDLKKITSTRPLKQKLVHFKYNCHLSLQNDIHKPENSTKLFSKFITLLPLCNKAGLLVGDLALAIRKLNWNMQQQIQGRPAERQ